MQRRKKNKIQIDFFKISQWVINFISIITLAFLLAFVFGNGIPNFFELSMRENLLFLCFFIIITGIIWSFWKKLIGGILVIVGSFAFWLINFIFTGSAWLGFYFWFFPFLGIILIYYWLKTKNKKGLSKK